MIEQKIKYGNNLIAEFMGGEYKNNLPYTFTKTGWLNTPANNNKVIAQYYDFRYHKSWEWLMPVCKKIIESYCDKREYIFEGLTECNIEKTYKAVIDFIHFWNDPKQEKIIWNKN